MRACMVWASQVPVMSVPGCHIWMLIGWVQRYSVGLLKNDIVVSGTDGLWDNVFPHEVAQLATALRDRGRSPQTTAQGLAEYAREM